MGFAGDINLGVIGKTTFFLISFSKMKGLGWEEGGNELHRPRYWNSFQNLPLPWRDFKCGKVKVEVKFVHVQEGYGIGS